MSINNPNLVRFSGKIVQEPSAIMSGERQVDDHLRQLELKGANQ